MVKSISKHMVGKFQEIVCRYKFSKAAISPLTSLMNLKFTHIHQNERWIIYTERETGGAVVIPNI